jgi:hypothetical protein
MNNPFQIDLNNLEQEWVDQPLLRKEYGEQLADAIRDAKEAEAELEVVESELKLEVRKNPEAYGFEKKPTVDEVKAVIPTLKRYKKAIASHIDKIHTKDIKQAAVAAADTKKYALQDLVDMRLNDLHSAPRTSSSNNSKIAEQQALSGARRASEKMRKRREDVDED